MNARSRLLALALLVAAGCHRPGPPSPAYAQARADFSHLYAQELDDAYVDPQMADVEAALRSVPADSVDHPNAQALLQRIQDGRTQVERERARTQQAMDEALAPPVMFEPSGAGSSGGLTAVAPAADAGADAGVADASTEPPEPVTGMSRAEFQKRFGDCFHPVGQATVGKGGAQATVYAVSGADCQKRFPGYQDRLLAVDGSQVLGTAPKSAYHPPPDAGTAHADAGSAADAGAPSRP